MLKHLAGLAKVHLACFADDDADAAHLPALREALGGRLGEAHVEVRRTGKISAVARALTQSKPVSLTSFDSPKLGAFVETLAGSGDIAALYAFSGQMAQFVPPGPRFVMDFVDMDSAKFAEYAASAPRPMRWLYAREAEKLFAFERATAARADASLFVSEAEAALFRARTGLSDIHAISNGIDLDFFDPGAEYPRLSREEWGEGPLIVFTGQMDYAPNVDAVRFFAHEVLPLIPKARFAIVGRNPTPAVRKLADERIVVTGAVPDTRSWLAAADAVVAPLRIARGIQNKVLEAMAMARPVVATSAAFEGIEAEPGRDLLVAHSAEAMAAGLNDLLSDPAKATAIGRAARNRVEYGYRWKARLAPVTALICTLESKAAA